MSFSEEQAFAALGVDQDAGAKEQETADPAQATAEVEGAKEQEVAEPAETTGGDSGKQEQTQEERADHAAERRRREQQAAIDEAVAKAIQEERTKNSPLADAAKMLMRRYGIEGEDYEKLKAAIEGDDSIWADAADSAGMSTEQYKKIMSLETENSRLLQERDSAQQLRQQNEAKAQVERELQEIHKLDPTINSVEDLMKAPNAKEFYDQVKSGKTFLEAFRLVNFDTIMQNAAKNGAHAGQQQALNSVGSKNHLNATSGQRGTGSSPVPGDVMEMFRAINPGATEAEILAYYNKTTQ